MNIKAVNGIDTQWQNLLGILLTRAGRGGQDSHIHILQLLDVLHYVVGGQLSWFVLCTLAAHHACNLKVCRSLQCLDGKFSDVAVTYYGCSDFLHFTYVYNEFVLFAVAKLHNSS